MTVPITSIWRNVQNTSSKMPDICTLAAPQGDGMQLCMKDHFSSLLLGGSISNTIIELLLLALPFSCIAFFSDETLTASDSMRFSEVAIFMVVASTVRRVYNAYLEAVFFTFPDYRTQPVCEHRLKKAKDLCGGDLEQVEKIDKHDKLTLLSQFFLNFGVYFLLPGFYPVASGIDSEQPLREKFVRLLLNHYILSFGMYWAHRCLHTIPWLWRNIHSFHHWARHPLSRNTYEGHWADNFANAIFGHVFAQILVPLDRPTYWFSRLFRILESLEKHSGISCAYNLAHSAQQIFPFAQMPHHHDWHHEGFKVSNYTFSSIGGVWDCIFGTRRNGRYQANNSSAATQRDLENINEKLDLPKWFSPVLPLVFLSVSVALKFANEDFWNL